MEIRLFDTIAAAAYLSMEPGTLEKWSGTGLEWAQHDPLKIR